MLTQPKPSPRETSRAVHHNPLVVNRLTPCVLPVARSFVPALALASTLAFTLIIAPACGDEEGDTSDTTDATDTADTADTAELGTPCESREDCKNGQVCVGGRCRAESSDTDGSADDDDDDDDSDDDDDATDTGDDLPGPGAGVLDDGDVTALAFDNVLVGASLTKTVTLTNITTGDFARRAIVKSLALDGPGRPAYDIVAPDRAASPLPLSIPTGEALDITVSFTPATLGEFTATLTIGWQPGPGPDLDTRPADFEIALTGKGVNTRFITRPEDETDFGTVLVGTSSNAKTFTVVNTSSRATEITAVTTTDPAIVIETITPEPPTTLAQGGGAIEATVVCTPTAVGLIEAAVEFATDAPGEETISFPVRCNALTANPDAPTARPFVISQGGQITQLTEGEIFLDGEAGPASIQLDGSRSSDPNSASLTYTWRVVEEPSPGAANLTPLATKSRILVAPPQDGEGKYVIGLTVTNTAGLASPEALVNLEAYTNDRLELKLAHEGGPSAGLFTTTGSILCAQDSRNVDIVFEYPASGLECSDKSISGTQITSQGIGTQPIPNTGLACNGVWGGNSDSPLFFDEGAATGQQWRNPERILARRVSQVPAEQEFVVRAVYRGGGTNCPTGIALLGCQPCTAAAVKFTSTMNLNDTQFAQWKDVTLGKAGDSIELARLKRRYGRYEVQLVRQP